MTTIWKTIWKKLPFELVNLILEYDGLMKLRNGKFMNQLINIDIKYQLILDRMRFSKNRKFHNATIGVSYVTNHIQHTDKYIYYWATEHDYRVTLYTKKANTAKILYYIKE